MYLPSIISLKNIHVPKNWKVTCSKYAIKVLKFALHKLTNLFLIFSILHACNIMFKELVECKRTDLINYLVNFPLTWIFLLTRHNFQTDFSLFVLYRSDHLEVPFLWYQVASWGSHQCIHRFFHDVWQTALGSTIRMFSECDWLKEIFVSFFIYA